MDDNTTPRVGLYTLGCKVNQAETDWLGRRLAELGCKVVPFDALADVYIVNTCSVTHVGDSKSRQILRRARRRNPKALVIATGCYASIVRGAMPVDDVVVVPNRQKDAVPEIALRHLELQRGQNVWKGRASEMALAPGPPAARARPMVKVQDGCDGICSYCIIPRARGRSRSTPPDAVINQVKALVDAGHKEVVITGVDLGSYGSESQLLPDLGGLVSLILERTSIHRIRISSLEPGDFNLKWLSLWKDRRMCRHLHVPLQAGSDEVLSRMRRAYDCHRFKQVVLAARAEIRGVAITTDLIAGFPQESESEHQLGIRFIESCELDGLHVFPYSARPGTAAAHLPGQVPENVKKQRAQELRNVAEERRRLHIGRNLGQEIEVVWESTADGISEGISDNNVRVYGTSKLMPGMVETGLLSSAYADGAWVQSAAGAPEPHQSENILEVGNTFKPSGSLEVV